MTGTRAVLDGVDVLRLSRPGIPDFDELSDRLQGLTGWKVVAVRGLVPDEDVFRHLAKRTLAGRLIREPEQIDYLQEPDIFHDVFGHVPLLTDPVADYMQAYGEGGELSLYGAGIVSSYGGSKFALDDPSPNRVGLDLRRTMRTRHNRRRRAARGQGGHPGHAGLCRGQEGGCRMSAEARFPGLFGALEPQPPDALLALIGLYRGDARPHKIDLGAGVYRDLDGATPVLAAVKAAEARLLAEQATKAYLGPEGDLGFLERLKPIIFGPATGEGAFGVQMPGGTGALRLAVELIAAARPGAKMLMGVPTGPNHPRSSRPRPVCRRNAHEFARR